MTADPFTHIRGVLLDKDGTIIDYARTWIPINCEVAMAAARGDRALADELLRAGGQDPESGAVQPGSPLAVAGVDGIANCFASVLGRRTPPDLRQTVEHLFAEGGRHHAVAIDGAAAVIAELREAGLKVGLATNDSGEGMHTSLARAGLAGGFDFLAAADSGFGAKPGSGMARAFAEATGLHPAALASVGDAAHDLEMARNAGYGLTIAVLSGTGTFDDLAPHADIVLESVRDLPGLLRSSRGASSSA